MKKAKTIGKKTLSVFLAVLMVLTAWVWVAPTEAEAAAAGTYDVKVHVDISNGMYSSDEKIIVDYYKDNGTGATGTVELPFRNDGDDNGTFNKAMLYVLIDVEDGKLEQNSERVVNWG